MEKLTKKEHEIALAAAELIDCGMSGWSCIAIADAFYYDRSNSGSLWLSISPRKKYANFYGKVYSDNWADGALDPLKQSSMGIRNYSLEGRHIRVMLLLMFAEVCS